MQGHVRKRVHSAADGRTTTTWYVVVDVGRDRTGKRRQKWHGGFRTRKEAEAARAKIVTDLNAGTYIEPSGISLESWVRDQWLPAMKTQVKPSTWDSYRRNMDLHVLPTLGSKSLQQITSTQLNTLYAELMATGRRNGEGGLSAKSVRYVHTIVHKALADALDAQLVQQNAASRAKPPKPRASGHREMGYWTAEQLSIFLASIRDRRLYAAFHLGAMTGMRRGELLGLRWGDVDLDARRLAVRHTIVSVAYDVQSSTPKTHQARVVDLDPVTVTALREHRARQGRENAEWGSSYDDGDLVFCKENGRPLHPDSFTQMFERLAGKCDLPRIRLHDLRHTHATIALQAGVPVKVISERLGHESPAFTLKQYAHVIPGMQAEAASLVAALVKIRPAP